jgi:alanyl-tRNA synthetase
MPEPTVTERLDRTDSHLLEFDARVIEIAERDGRRALVLDRSAFYPTGGGQPFDTGRIGDLAVVDVVAESDEGGRVFHFVDVAAGGALPAVGATVHGKVDAARRRDHLQQHTGQHILSQAFVVAAKLETRSFHLGAETSTIDVDPGASDAVVAQAVALANDVVFFDRELRVHEVAAEELPRFNVRKQTFHGARIRLVEVVGFDVSTCGGTHARRAGEVGLIAVKSVERTKGLHRVEFVCGGRALREYERDRRILDDAARRLSTAGDQVAVQVGKLADLGQQLKKRVKQLFEIAADVQARELLAGAVVRGGRRVVTAKLADLSLDEAQLLARQIAKTADGPPVVALLGIADGEGGKLVFARSGAAGDAALPAMGALVKAITERFGGRGGGSPGSAQGAIAKASELEAALAAARDALPA